MPIVVNQSGFATRASKRAVFVADSAVDAKTFSVENRTGDIVFQGNLGEPESLWGRRHYAVEFSALTTPGTYFLRIGDITSPAFRVGPNEPAASTLHAAVEFFFIQRCGMEVPGWHGPCHMDDGMLPDGTIRDAAGGWHDAGDYNKYNGYTPLSVAALLLAQGTAPKFFAQCVRNGRTAAVDEAEWGAQWLAKMVDPATGRLWRDIFSGYGFWGRPEDETDNQPGTGDERKFRAEPAGAHEHEMGVAAFALLATALPDSGNWRERAEALWRASDALTVDAPMRVAAGIVAGLALHRLAGDSNYAGAVAALVQRLLAGQRSDGLFADPHIVDYGLPAAALALTAMELPSQREGLVAPLLRYLEGCLDRSSNPYSILKFDADNFFFNYGTPDAWHVGQNSMYLSQAWAAALIWRLTGDGRAQTHAQDLVDWVLGRNPFGICMMDAAGTHHSPLYHHRYNAIPGHETGAVPGAVVNGIVRLSPEEDMPRYDLRTEGRAAYQTNEPWLPHNAYYLLAVTALCFGEDK